VLASALRAQEKPSAPAGSGAAMATYAPTMTFDVASVRQSKESLAAGITMGASFNPVDSSHARVQNFQLEDLVEWSYGLNFLRIEWPKDVSKDLLQTRFNVEAKADGEMDERLAKLTKAEIKLEQQHMMQAMLAERFNLQAHWVTRDAKTYDLVVVKPGRMKESTGAQPSAEDLKVWGDKPVPTLYEKGNSNGGMEHIAHGASMAEITEMLAGWFRHPMTDKTGLTGKYDFDVKSYQVYAAERKDDETNPWPTLSAAIQDQLGLKVVPTHGPVAMLVIDHVGQLSEN